VARPEGGPPSRSSCCSSLSIERPNDAIGADEAQDGAATQRFEGWLPGCQGEGVRAPDDGELAGRCRDGALVDAGDPASGLDWSKAAVDGSECITFRWREEGGPPVSPPTEKGFGRAVLEHVMAEHFGVPPPRIEFASKGLSYELSGPLDAMR
jgi:hypothetical protein